MKLHYQDERATIWQGDALSVLLEIETASIDAIVTDPPYSSGGMVRSDRMAKTGAKYVQSDSSSQSISDFSGDNRDQRAYAYWMALWLSEALRVTKPGGLCLLFTDWRQLPSTVDALQAGGWVWRGLVPWVKPSARPMSGRFTNAAEYVVWGSAGSMGLDFDKPTFPGFYRSTETPPGDVNPFPPVFEGAPPREREHITQKPVDVMWGLVKIVPAGGTILDLFMGSGTTGVASMIEGYRFVGAELLDEFCDVSTRRIQQAELKASEPVAGQGVFDLAGGDS